MLTRNFILLLLPFIFPLILSAQDTAKFKVQENYKREFVIGDKRYRVYDNWVNFGAGIAYHSKNPRMQMILGLDMNFHIKKAYFNAGGYVSGDGYGQWNNYQLHAGYFGFRKQNLKMHMAACGGLSFTNGYEFVYAGHYLSQPFNELGIYAEYQYVRKKEYTTGLGLTTIVNVNKKGLLVGLRLDGYLSGAYRGYVKGKEPRG